MVEESDLLKLAQLVRAQVLLTHHIDSCVATTRAMIDACEALGWEARPLPVTLNIYNARILDLLDMYGYPELSELPADVAQEWAKEGAAFVGVGYGDSDDNVGHLVTLVETTWLVDASLDQAHRPHKGIVLDEPLVMPIERYTSDTFSFINDDGVVLRYDAEPADTRYLASPDWTVRQRTEYGVRQAVAQFRQYKKGGSHVAV